ncbi:hypothetical protein GCM10029978_021210 [Actinoallomurus acanthiterrae]
MEPARGAFGLSVDPLDEDVVTRRGAPAPVVVPAREGTSVLGRQPSEAEPAEQLVHLWQPVGVGGAILPPSHVSGVRGRRRGGPGRLKSRRCWWLDGRVTTSNGVSSQNRLHAGIAPAVGYEEEPDKPALWR